ncbi:MAG: alpha/beta fold hydrolase [Myxococcales bacterium]|nr:alpha/beta fold hydrolase [Myxococcales bacterium]MCB9749111.1 alpha/beta fold hydrolase [Myxococcales bacterium]
MRTDSAGQRESFGARVSGALGTLQELAHAARSGATGPYPYLAPLVRRAAGVGEPPLHPTPYTVVWTRGPARLLRFQGGGPRKFRTPILFVYSLINRYYVLDFLPGRSLVEFMLEQGYDVYAIDWGTAGPAEQQLTWDYYLGTLIAGAVRWTLRTSGARDLTMYGYCMGGTMALAYAALYPAGLRNFVAQATPVDFSEGGVFTTWTRPEFFDVDALVDAYGNMPIDLMESGVSMMAPIQRLSKWFEVFRQIDNPGFITTFLGMERWASDNVPFPGEVYRQYIKDCYQENNFCNGRMVVGGRRVDLGEIRCPLLTLTADRDTTAPPRSSEPLNELVSSEDTTLMNFPVGHVGLSTSSKGRTQIWPRVSEWIAARSEPE